MKCNHPSWHGTWGISQAHISIQVYNRKCRPLTKTESTEDNLGQNKITFSSWIPTETSLSLLCTEFQVAWSSSMAGPTDNKHDLPGVCVDIFIAKQKDTHTPSVLFPLKGFLPRARRTHAAFPLHSYSGPPSSTCTGASSVWMAGPSLPKTALNGHSSKDTINCHRNIKPFSAIIFLRKCALFWFEMLVVVQALTAASKDNQNVPLIVHREGR